MLLFNWCGYQLLNAYLDTRATDQLQKKLDLNNYDESELISVKVSAEHLSYYNTSKQFERVDGQIEISELQYNYVKRRLYNDSIEMLCIPNHEAMHLRKAKNDFFKLVNDLKQPGQEKKPDSHAFKIFAGDYCTLYDLFKVENLYYSIQKNSNYYSVKLPAHSLCTYEHPPEKIA